MQEEVKNEVKKEKKEEKKLFKKNKVNHEVEELKQQVMDLQTKYMYCQAELINYKKRSDERIQELLKYKNEDLLLDLTDMVENLDRASAVKVESEESKKIQVGIQMVANQFKEILKKYDVIEIEALGYPFDPVYMDAMMIDNDLTKPDDMVTAVLRKGYKYKDRVLKHAQVKVNKNEVQEQILEERKQEQEKEGNE